MNTFGALTDVFGEPSVDSPGAELISFSASIPAVLIVAVEASAVPEGLPDPSMVLSSAESDGGGDG